MTTDELRRLLDEVDDTGEVVLDQRAVTPAWLVDELFVAWSAARVEANHAYESWCRAPGETSYVVYRAAEDRADAAEATLRVAAARRPLAIA